MRPSEATAIPTCITTTIVDPAIKHRQGAETEGRLQSLSAVDDRLEDHLMTEQAISHPRNEGSRFFYQDQKGIPEFIHCGGVLSCKVAVLVILEEMSVK